MNAINPHLDFMIPLKGKQIVMILNKHSQSTANTISVYIK